MAFSKVIIFATLVACFVALASALKPIQSEERPVTGPLTGQPGVPFSGQGLSKEESHARDKKFAYFSSYAYTYPSYYSYPYASYSYSYPKPFYHPYAYGAYYPGYHFY